MDTYTHKREMILNGNINRTILYLAGPIMLNNFIQTIYNLTDTFWVSRLGGMQMAAMTLVWPVIFFMMAIGMGINVAGTSLISQYIGAGDNQQATKVAGQILSFSAIFSLTLGLIGAFFSADIVKLMGGEGELLIAGTRYLKTIFLGMPTIFLFLAFTAIKQGQGDTITPMKYSGLSVGLNIILDPIFIHTFNLGIGGAALATVLSRGIFTTYAIYKLFNSSNGIRIGITNLKFNTSLQKKIIKIGFPSSVGQSTAALGFIVLNIFIISFGQNTLAAFGIGNRINSLILMPAMGIGNALATIVGQNLGAGQIERARKAVKASTLLATSLLLVGGLIFFPFISQVIKFFTKESEIALQAVHYLRLITLSLPLMGFYQIFVGTFQGSGHTVLAMILMMGRLWALRIPMIVLFSTYSSWGSNSVWYAMVLSNAFTVLAGFGIYLSGKWEQKVIKSKSRSELAVSLDD